MVLEPTESDDISGMSVPLDLCTRLRLGSGGRKDSSVGWSWKVHSLEPARPRFKSWLLYGFGQMTQPLDLHFLIYETAIMVVLDIYLRSSIGFKI